MLKYVLTHPERLKEIEKRYRTEKHDNVMQASRKWKKLHPEKVKADGKAYRVANPEKIRSAQRRRRARKMLNGTEPYTEQQVLALYGTDCHICKEPINMGADRRVGSIGWENSLHIDHLIPISKGGPDTLENVSPAHGFCNISRGDSVLG